MSFSLWTMECSSIHAGAKALGLVSANNKSHGNAGKGEIKKKFDGTVAFAEIERSLATPVKRYSCGVYIHLPLPTPRR